MRHYRLKTARHPRRPALLFQVKLNYQDPRSGYRGSGGGWYRGEWIKEPALEWTRDMVERVEESQLLACRPPRAMSWPEGADQKVLRYFSSYGRPEVLRNLSLGLYSYPGEGREEFLQRCKEELRPRYWQALRPLCDAYQRRLSELEERWLGPREGDWPEGWQGPPQERVRQLFARVREDLNRISLREDFRLWRQQDFDAIETADQELADRLQELIRQLVSEQNRRLGELLEQVQNVESYRVPLKLSQIEIISRDILWME